MGPHGHFHPVGLRLLAARTENTTQNIYKGPARHVWLRTLEVHAGSRAPWPEAPVTKEHRPGCGPCMFGSGSLSASKNLYGEAPHMASHSQHG